MKTIWMFRAASLIKRLGLSIEYYIYDSYCKITLLQISNSLYLPVRPSVILSKYPEKQIISYTRITKALFIERSISIFTITR